MADTPNNTYEVSRFESPGMSLLEHLEELRKRIINSAVSVVIAFFVGWNFKEDIFEFVQRPIITALKEQHMPPRLIFLHPTEPFELYMRIAFVAGVFLAAPYILWQVWQFISPGLYRHEKKYVFPFLFVTVGLFLCGGAFGYAIVFPNTLSYLIFMGKGFEAQITINEYSNLFTAVMLGLGIVFEIPVLIFFLAFFGIVDAKMLWKYARFAIFGIFLVAAIVSPTPDAVNMCIFAAPMCVLYFLSIGIAWLAHPSRRNRNKEKSTI
jgi:sec-independent protein translocase protein TatC